MPVAGQSVEISPIPVATTSWQGVCNRPGMPRRSFRGSAGFVFHVMNRGVRGTTLFACEADYAAYFKVLSQAYDRTPVRLLEIVAMPTHFHMVIWARADTDLTRFVGWLSLTHARRWQLAHGTLGTGAVYQGRFKAIPVQTSDYLLTVCRYVVRNPVRAGLVQRARNWPWSSMSETPGARLPPLHDWPLPRPGRWQAIVDGEESTEALDQIRTSITRGSPFGDEDWTATVVRDLGWTTGIRPAGRPCGSPPAEITPGVISSAGAAEITPGVIL